MKHQSTVRVADAKVVPIAEANWYSEQGEWVPNRRFGKVDRNGQPEPQLVFQAKYIVHHRPVPHLPEKAQFALVEEA